MRRRALDDVDGKPSASAFGSMRYAIHGQRHTRDGRLFDADRGCTVFSAADPRPVGRDRGHRKKSTACSTCSTAAAPRTIDGHESTELRRGTALFSPATQRWAARGSGPRRLGARPRSGSGRRVHAVVDVDRSRARERHGRAAVPPRPHTRLSAALSVTQFVGSSRRAGRPTTSTATTRCSTSSRARARSTSAASRSRSRPGACVHLPARLVHCLENTGDDGDAAARRLPAGRLAGRGLLPRRHARRLRAGETDVPRIERVAESSGKGTSRAARGDLGRRPGAFGELPYSLPTRIEQARGQDEPRGAARRGARRLLHDVARRRADRAGTPPSASRRRARS